VKLISRSLDLKRGPKVTRFWVKNFKSLRDLELELKDFNLLIGPNASGKSNIIEAFKLFEKIYSAEAQYVNPFLEWWGYQNVVWRGKEELPVVMGFEVKAGRYRALFEVTVSGLKGIFEVLRETV